MGIQYSFIHYFSTEEKMYDLMVMDDGNGYDFP